MNAAIVDDALAAAGSDAVEVVAQQRRVHERRWLNGELIGDLRRDETGLAVRVCRDGRVGLAAAGGSIDPAALVATARSAAREGASTPSRFATDTVSSRVPLAELAREPEDEPEVIELVRRLGELHHGVAVSVQVVTTDVEQLIRTTDGGNAADRRAVTVLRAVAGRASTDEVLDLLYEAPWGAARAAWGWLDSRLRWTRRWVSVPAVDLPIVLTPRALHALIAEPIATALSGPALLDGTSFLTDHDRDTSSQGLTLIDDPTLAGAPRSRHFDDEGIPTARRDLLRDGAVAGELLDLGSAERLGRSSTGCAWRHWYTWPAPAPSTLVVPTGTLTLADLLRRWPRAILVDDLSGEWFTDAGDAGVTASAELAFLVERGEVVGRLRGLSLSAARGKLLRGALVFSRETEWVGDRAVLPYAHAAGLTVSEATP